MLFADVLFLSQSVPGERCLGSAPAVSWADTGQAALDASSLREGKGICSPRHLSSREFSLGLPCGWHGPSDLSYHLLPARVPTGRKLESAAKL